MYKRSTLGGIARQSGWRDNMGEEHLPLFLPVAVLQELGDAHPYYYAASLYADTVIGVPLQQIVQVVEPTRNLMNVSTQIVPPQDQQEPEPEPQPQQMNKVGGGSGQGTPPPMPPPPSNPTSGKGGGGGSGLPQYVASTGAAKGESKPEPDESEGKGNGPPPKEDVKERHLGNDKASDGETQDWVRRESEWGSKQKTMEWKKKLWTGLGTRWHGNYGGEESKTSLGDRKLAEKMRVSLDKLVGSFDMQITPLWNAKKLVTRHLTHRTLTMARKEEEGRPSILILSDISGSCQETSEMSTLVANSACMLGTLDADVFSLPISDYMYQPGVEPVYEEHGKSYHNGTPLAFSRYDTEHAKAIREMTDPAAFARFGVPPAVAQEMMNMRSNAYRDTRRGADPNSTLQVLALAAEMRRPFNQKSKTWDTNMILANPLNEHTGIKDWVAQLALTNHPILSRFSKLQEFGRKPVFHTHEWGVAHKARYVEMFEQVQAEMEKYPETKGQGMPMYTHPHAEVSASGKFIANSLVTNINADIVIFYTDNDGIPLIKEILPMLQSHQRLYVITYMGVPNAIQPSTGNPAIKARNGYGYEGVITYYPEYGEPQEGTVPTLAFRPSRQYDWKYIPGWLGDNRGTMNQVGGFAGLSGCLGAEKLTVIPNVADLPGYLWAINAIVSPDKMQQALNSGKAALAHFASRRDPNAHPMA